MEDAGVDAKAIAEGMTIVSKPQGLLNPNLQTKAQDILKPLEELRKTLDALIEGVTGLVTFEAADEFLRGLNFPELNQALLKADQANQVLIQQAMKIREIVHPLKIEREAASLDQNN